MGTIVALNWWALTLRGLCAILFGVLALALPGVTLIALAVAFGIYALADGVFSLTSGYRHYHNDKPWGMMLTMGVVGIIAALISFFWPGVTALTLVYFFGAWLIVRGVMEIVAAVQLRKEIRDEWLLGLAGALSIAAGAFIFFYPVQGAIATVTMIGITALFYGGTMLALGFRIRRFADTFAAPRPGRIDRAA